MFSDKITELRKSRGLTQKAFADLLNVEQQTVSKWECGKGVPDLIILIDIAKKFGVSLDELLETSPEAEEDKPNGKDTERDFREITEKFVRNGYLDLNGLEHAFNENEYAYKAVERAVNALPVSFDGACFRAIGNKDYKFILKNAVSSSLYDDALMHLLADDLEYVDYLLENRCGYGEYKRRRQEEEDGKLRKSFLISYALRLSDKSGETADGNGLRRLVEKGKLKEFIAKSFERLVLKMRAKRGDEAGAEELLREYLDKLDGEGYDMDDDYCETEEHRVAVLMCECRNALHGYKPLPRVTPEELFRFIEMIEEV